MGLTAIIFGIIVALVSTLAIEIPIYWAFKRYDSFKYVTAMIIATSLTNIIMNIIINVAIYYMGNNGYYFLILFELLAYFIEAFVAYFFIGKQAFIVSLLANLASFTIGGLFGLLMGFLYAFGMSIIFLIILAIIIAGLFIELVVIYKASLRD